ncbi:MAG: terminase large subunit [Planctomycetaceae bacterium]
MNTALRGWISRLNFKRSLDTRTAAWSPEFFRRILRLGDGDRRPLGERVLDWQVRDFRALDRAWLHLAGIARVGDPAADRPIVRRAYLERPRGHSKTFDTGVQLAWVLFAARRPVRGLCAAADLEQGLLIQGAVERLARANPELLGKLQFRAQRIVHPKSGSRVDFLSSNVASSWGHDPDFVICDELCHWSQHELWQSLVSSAGKRPHCVLLVLSNAGIGRGWHWQVREAARTGAGWYFSRLDGPQAPWISAEQLDEQRRLLLRDAYERLWLNTWQDGSGEFVSLAEAEECRDAQLRPQARGQPQFAYVGSVDYAEKHDLTVGCVCHRAEDRVIVDRLDVVRPSAVRPTEVRWVSEWLQRMSRDFGNIRFVVDEHQLVGVVQQLERQHWIRRFPFAGGRGNHLLAMLLRRLIVERKLAWFPGCGSAPAADGARDDLETELASLLVHQSTVGHLRIDHIADGRHHDDRSFALGAACLELMEGNLEPDFLEIRGPRGDGTFDW